MNYKYITTPIFYVNDLPHIGHAYTTIICDTISRFFILNNEKVLFTTGTDEHGLKVEKAAKAKGMTPNNFVDEVSENFRNLTKKLKIINTDFIRTTEERHKISASAFWNKLCERDQIYKGKYKGWYSVKDESFYQEKELVKENGDFFTQDGSKVDWIEEESFFFKLSGWQKQLLDFYENNPNFIQPVTRMNEVKSFVEAGLKDLSVSRTSFNWGIKIPGSNNHIMYVWIDALTNYITSLGYPDIKETENTFWKNCIHVIGKDILKFHGVYWPAMLMAIDFPLPKTILAHGWWTNEGKKISKSLGNTINPDEIINKFGLDQFRYFLLREVPFANDGDFSEKSMLNRINSDLSNNLGNLIQRVMKFLNKNFDSIVPKSILSESENIEELKKGYKLFDSVKKKMDKFQISKSLEEIFLYIDDLNRFMDKAEPWKTFKNDPEKAGRDLSMLIECFRIIGIILQPFLPDASKNILDMLNIDESSRGFKDLSHDNAILESHVLNKPQQLFPRYEE